MAQRGILSSFFCLTLFIWRDYMCIFVSFSKILYRDSTFYSKHAWHTDFKLQKTEKIELLIKEQ